MQTATKPRYRIGTDGSNLRQVNVPAVMHGKVGAQYMRGNDSPYFFSWTPALRDQREDVRAAYTHAAARAVDAVQNSGWIAGAIDQAVASTIGTGLRIAAKPDGDVLGWTPEATQEWARMVERRFEAWGANPLECDAAGKNSLGQLARSVLMNFFAYGEALGLLPLVNRRGGISKTRTKVKLLPPHKLVQDSDNIRMFQGVLMDDWGLPRGYRLRLRIGGIIEETVDLPARDAAGRPQVFHIFEGGPDVVRGITPMAPALRVVRQFDQLSDATLTAALIQAIFAATIQSQAPTEEILRALQSEGEQKQGVGGGSIDDYLGAKAGWYKDSKIDLGRSGRIAHLFPGETLDFHASEAPNATYEAFAKFLLREIARCLGMTFETLTGDYSGATYSSVRMATSEIWPIIMARRNNIAGRFYQTVYEAWLDEEIDAGRIEFPGGFEKFVANKDAASRAEWRGPAKPQADDLKTAKAHEIYKRLGIMSDERICADLGYDWEDEFEQRAREIAMRKQLGLPETDTIAAPAGAPGERIDDLDR
jgi:lambda family phage portal protein